MALKFTSRKSKTIYILFLASPLVNQCFGITRCISFNRPQTLSENLSRNATRIDFTKISNDDDLDETFDIDDLNAEIDAEEEKDPAQFQPNLWPWDSIRNKLRDAFTEVSVLSDVLSIAKEKKYMVLDPVPQEPPEVKPMVHVYAKKKSLTSAGNILLTGAERLKNLRSQQHQQHQPSAGSKVSDFHVELLRLRGNWRLKKVSNTIIGDLSYRTAGSKYPHPGMFEVTKAEDDESDDKKSLSGPSSTPSPQKSISTIRVNVPSDLQGVAYIKVITQKDQEDLCTASVNLIGHGTNIMPQPGIWQKSLDYAQNVLFCKELFQQLAKEAVTIQAPIPHVVVGNQIRATLLPGIQLIISLCHTTSLDPVKTGPMNDHDHVLEHSLHQLLRELHYKNTHHPFPHPSSGPLGPSKKRMLAGPMALDRRELLEMTKTQTLLEQIIAQAQHIFMRKRTQYVLDTLARDVKDPQIISHWNSMNSPTMSCVKINIITCGYDTVYRTSLLIHVKERSLKCISRDGCVMHMSYEPQELRDLILCQINHHQIHGLQMVAKCLAWQTLSSSNNLGIGSVEPLGNASSCVLASPNGDRLIAVQVRCDPPQIDVKVYIAQSPRKDFFTDQLVQGKYWENLGGHFKEVKRFVFDNASAIECLISCFRMLQVRFDKLEGKNFLNKMEFLMASLSSSS